MPDFDPFKGSAGGWAEELDGTTVTFTNCRFGKTPGYTDSNTGDMVLVFLHDYDTDADVSNPDMLEDQILTIGKGWDAKDDGAQVVRSNGSNKGFNTSSRIQMWIDRMFELDGGEAALRARYQDTGYTPQHAAFWNGLTVTLGVHQVEVMDKTRDVLLPDTIIGWGDENGSGGEAEAEKPKKAPAKKKAAKKAPEPAEDDTVPADMVAAIEAIAAEAEDADEFIARCYDEIDGLDENADAMALVDDVDSDDSIWVKAVEAAS